MTMPKPVPIVPVKKSAWKEFALFLVFLAVVALVLVARVRLLSIPFERDEGEYAYIAQQFLKGVMPFAETHNMKMPGIYFVYAGCMALFGRDLEGIHIGLLVANLASVLLVALLARIVISKSAGYVAGSVFAVLSLSETVLGVYAHAEHFVMLCVIPGLLLLYLGCSKKRWILAAIGSVLLGSSFCILQHGAFFVAFGALFAAVHAWNGGGTPRWLRALKAGSIVVGFAAVPVAVLFLTMYLSGVFGDFWYWTFTYARKYVTMRSLGYGAETFRIAVVPMAISMALPWVAGCFGLVCLLRAKSGVRPKLFVVGFGIASLIAITPGLYFRDHYFVLLLPAVSLLCAAGMDVIFAFVMNHSSRFTALKLAGVLAVVALWPILVERTNLYATPTTTLSNTKFYPNAFAESIVIGRFIEENSRAADRIAVVGSEPQIYFYAHRKAATSFMYTYPLMELHPNAAKQQQQMISEIETAKPKFLLLVRNPLSWLSVGASDTRIFYWFHEYSLAHYAIVGCADRVSRDSTNYVFGAQCQIYRPQSQYGIDVYQRVN